MIQSLCLYRYLLNTNRFLGFYQIYWQYVLGQFLKKWESNNPDLDIETLIKQTYITQSHKKSWQDFLERLFSMVDEEGKTAIVELLLTLPEGKEQEFSSIFLAVNCSRFLSKNQKTLQVLIKLQKYLLDLSNYELNYTYEPYLDSQATKIVHNIHSQAILALGKMSNFFPENLKLLRNNSIYQQKWYIRQASLQALEPFLDSLATQQANGYSTTFKWLETIVYQDEDEEVRKTAIEIISRHFRLYPGIKELLQKCAIEDKNLYVQQTAIQSLARGWYGNKDVFEWLKNLLCSEADPYLRETILEEISKLRPRDPTSLEIVKNLVENEADAYVRGMALQALAKQWPQEVDTLILLRQKAFLDSDSYVRSIAIQSLAKRKDNQAKIITWLKQSAYFDEDEYVKSIAIQQLSRCWYGQKDIFQFLKEIAISEDNYYVRSITIKELAQKWKDQQKVLPLLQKIAETTQHTEIKHIAIQAIAQTWPERAEVYHWLKYRIVNETDQSAKIIAIQELRRYTSTNPELFEWLQTLMEKEKAIEVKSVIVEELTKSFSDQLEIIKFLQAIVRNNKYSSLRSTALQELTRICRIKYPHKSEELFKFLAKRATQDPFERIYPFEYNPRQTALELIIKYYIDHPATKPLLENCAQNDSDEELKRFVRMELAKINP